jgi:predicted nucleic acid-binding protein
VPPSSPRLPTDRPAPGGRGPIVIDAGVFGAELVPGSRLARRYEPLITGRPAFISFQTVAELHFGALRRHWGAARIRKLTARIARAEVVHSGPELVLAEARVRVACERVGHALAQSEHTADRCISTTAVRLGIPVVSDDGIFANAPGLTLLTVPEA